MLLRTRVLGYSIIWMCFNCAPISAGKIFWSPWGQVCANMNVVKAVQQLLSRWENAWALGGLLLFFESLLCALIIIKRPYTKIDWDAYMQVQVNAHNQMLMLRFLLNSRGFVFIGSWGSHATRAVGLQSATRRNRSVLEVSQLAIDTMVTFLPRTYSIPCLLTSMHFSNADVQMQS